MLRTSRTVVVLLMALACAPAMAAQRGGGGFDTNNLFFGAGLSSNSVSGSDNGFGWQIFGGYEFGEIARNVNFDVEVGYMDTGDMDVDLPFGFGTVSARAKGVWANAVGRFTLAPQWELVGRAGYDFGDDDGFMIGIGGGYNVNKQTTLRLEFVQRDNVDSIEFNFVYRP
ncbi:MAG: outer membrane beta-barrel protein [Sulfurifustis sp.]